MASSDNCPWREEIRKKLIAIFEKDGEALMRILWYLDQQDIQYKDSSRIPPAWGTLKSVLTCSGDVFKKYAERMAEDTRRAENDAAFRQALNTFYSQMMDASEQLSPGDTGEKFDVARLKDLEVAMFSGTMGFVRAWSVIPVPTQLLIREIIPKITSNRQIALSIYKVATLANKVSGTVATITLAAITLGLSALTNLSRWWKGEITGVRCCKNIIDSTFTIGAGVAGSVGGAAMGAAVAGPIGIVVGGILGGIVSGQVGSYISDRLTQSLFGIPKDEALENAYRFIGVTNAATNNEINTAFRQLCLIHHPDKGGTDDDFRLVQLHMEVIKLARGEQL